ncbi:MAG: hypothetical protein V3T86_05325 [Planctomycetota bacterium]
MSKSAVSWILVVGCAAFWAGYLVPRDSGTVERSDRALQVRNAEQDQRLAEQDQRLDADKARLAAAFTLQESLRARLTLLERRAQENEEKAALVAEHSGEPATAPDGPPTDDEAKEAIKSLGAQLQGIILGNEAGKKAGEEFRKFFARTTPEQRRKIIEKFEDDTQDIQQRLVIAHALAQSHDPDALEALKAGLRDPDADLMRKRVSSHGLAFSDAEGLDTFLSEMANNADDRGVRANSAFGLTRRGIAEGVDLYFAATDDALKAGDPAGLQYMSGLALMGEQAYPAMRSRLLTYDDEQALVTLITIVRKVGDKGAIENLQKLAFDSSKPMSVQNAAKGALTKLQAADSD